MGFAQSFCAVARLGAKQARGGSYRRRLFGALAVLLTPLQQTIAAPAPAGVVAAQEDDIVVVARRIGLPMWHVDTPRGTLIAVGDIPLVVKNTEWNSSALDQALQRADRVLFPGMRLATGSPLGALGAIQQSRRHSKLQAGESLVSLVSAQDWGRLQRLRQVGLLKEGFESQHPYQLATELQRRTARGVDYAPSLRFHIMRTARRHRVNLVPIEAVRLRTAARDFFETGPSAHVPCLLDAVALAEAGPGAIYKRSQDWVQRRVPEVLASPAERVANSCRLVEGGDADDIWRTLVPLLDQPGVTLAVVNLSTLASKAGVLDRLQSRGLAVRGPAWRN